ncbi:MAG: NUDIX hydrolase [Clostridia bacterium]|nr:NUDIX hydrolase [Clostridia bacterium]
MELFSHEIKDINELKQILKNNKEVPENYNIAVIASVFDKENKLILQRRGSKCRDERFKLEGIGGGVKETDSDFRSALNREILEEVGTDAVIKIEEFITAIGESTFDLRENKEKYWILLLYKGILEEGELQIMEPDKNLGYERYKIGEVDEDELSTAARKLYSILKERI